MAPVPPGHDRPLRRPFHGPVMEALEPRQLLSGDVPSRVVSATGMPAPGMGPGVTFATDQVLSPVINDAGQVVFSQRVQGPGIDPALGTPLFGGPVDGALSVVVRPGDPVPGTGGSLSYFAADTPALNDDGQLLFLGSFAGAGPAWSNVGVMGAAALGDAPHVLARIHGTAHGVAGGATFAFPLSPGRLSESGQAIFFGAFEGAAIPPGSGGYFAGPVTG